MKCRTVAIIGCACDTCRTGSGGCRTFPDGKKPVGTVIEHPDAYKLVQLGVAVPEDEECIRRANMTELQMAQAQQGQRRVSLGIHPEDYEAFDAGEIAGYYPDGTAIPGPNAEQSEEGVILP